MSLAGLLPRASGAAATNTTSPYIAVASPECCIRHSDGHHLVQDTVAVKGDPLLVSLWTLVHLRTRAFATYRCRSVERPGAFARP